MSEFNEPWTTFMDTAGDTWSPEGAVWQTIRDRLEYEIVALDSSQDRLADRIVACVNALAGVSTEQIGLLVMAGKWALKRHQNFPLGDIGGQE